MTQTYKATLIDLCDTSVRVKGRTILSIDRLSVNKGERVAIIGPNGAGKSTLVRLLAGLVTPDRGRIDVLGFNLSGGLYTMPAKQQRHFRMQCGLLMQSLPLIGRLTALENIMIGALAHRDSLPLWRSLARLYPSTLVERARYQLTQLGIAHLQAVRADRLSGGERQKVALARLSMQRAQLILADEPTSALDPASTRMASEFLNTLADKTTMIAVVHNLELLPVLADRVLGIANSRLAFDLPTSQISTHLLTSLYCDKANERAGERVDERSPDLHPASMLPSICVSTMPIPHT